MNLIQLKSYASKWQAATFRIVECNYMLSDDSDVRVSLKETPNRRQICITRAAKSWI